VNPARHPHVKAADGQAFIDWLLSPEGQNAIADYKIGGVQLFFPDGVNRAAVSRSPDGAKRNTGTGTARLPLPIWGEMLWGRRRGCGTIVAAKTTDGAPHASQRFEQVPRRL